MAAVGVVPSPAAARLVDDHPSQLDIWSAILSDKKQPAAAAGSSPYVHPLVRRSSSSLSQHSLELCTESLGSETGSDGFSSGDLGARPNASAAHAYSDDLHAPEPLAASPRRSSSASAKKELLSVNYRSSGGARSFPPPLPSLSRRDGPCFSMRTRRADGRLVLEAVATPSKKYLHTQRHGGRLRLSFIDCAARDAIPDADRKQQLECAAEMEMMEEEEDEQVEVVDRGIVLEVKVSTQPQLLSGAVKVHRSSLVINKFVGSTPFADASRWRPDVAADADDQYAANPAPPALPPSPLRRVPSTTATTTVAAAVAAAASSTGGEYEACAGAADAKLLFASRREGKEELLRRVRRCSELRRPIFIWEHYCIPTSS